VIAHRVPTLPFRLQMFLLGVDVGRNGCTTAFSIDDELTPERIAKFPALLRAEAHNYLRERREWAELYAAEDAR
jgi:hypothetical protein